MAGRGTQWTRISTFDGKRVESLGVFNGFLWGGSYDGGNFDGGNVYRFDGDSWKDMGRLGNNGQTYSFAVHRGGLCVGTWMSGRVYRLEKETWEDLGRLGRELEVMGMLVHNGQLYAGTLPSANVYRYDGKQVWTKLATLYATPGVKYRRAWTAAAFQGRLFWTTLPTGRVHSMSAGACVTWDRELSAGWHHVAAVKRGGQLLLFVDGRQVARSDEFDPEKFDLTCSAPLKIGAGAGDTFHGSLSDVRLYDTALSAEQIQQLAR